MAFLDWLMVFGYFGVLAAVVLVTLKKHKIQSGEDLFLGGRSDGQTAQSLADGWQVLKQTIKTTGATERFALFHSLSHPTFPWLGVMVASLVSGCWYWCTDQFIMQRTLAAKDLTNARRGVLFGSILRFTPVFLFIVPGMLGYALHMNHVSVGGSVFAIPMKTLADGSQALNGDTVFPTLVQTILPVGFLGFVLGMAKLAVNALAPASAVATFQDYYFSGVLLVISFVTVALASLSAPPPDESRLKGLNFSCLDANYRAENRASWNWVDVTVSIVVVGLVVSAYLYFFNWLGGGC